MKKQKYDPKRYRKYIFDTITHWILIPKDVLRKFDNFENQNPSFTIKFTALESCY